MRLLVVSATDGHCAGVDLDTGALIRTWAPALPEVRIRPYDVVEVTCDGESDLVPDPFQPEGIGVTDAPVVVDHMGGPGAGGPGPRGRLSRMPVLVAGPRA
jgi:hypothetical protein